MPDGSTLPAPSRRRTAALPAGLVPRYLSREEAAAYLGVSPETFDREVEAGWWPSARRRGEKGTRLTWDRLALDAAADQASGLGQPLPASPALAAQRAVAEAAALKGVINGAARQLRHQHRPPQAR